MLRISDLRIDTSSIGEMLLVEIRPQNEYKDGIRSEKIIGYKYIVACREYGLRKLAVKIEGRKLFDDEILKDLPEVEFLNLEIKIYQTKDSCGISATASGIKLKGDINSSVKSGTKQ